MLRLITILLLLCCIVPCHAQYFDTLHIHYDIGVAGLQKKDKTILDSIAQHSGNRKMLIYSYADYLGSERPNQHLSYNRALEVKNYLLEKGLKPEQIMECSGLGKVPGSGGSDGDVTYRRTDIFIRKEQEKVAERKIEAQKKTITATKTSLEKIPVDSVNITTLSQPVKSKVSTFVARQKPAPGKVTEINLEQLQVNQTLNLENLLFWLGYPELLSSSYSELDNLYRLMHNNPTLKIKLEGHVCCTRYPDGYFKDTPAWGLSVKRAFTIYKELISRGIAPERMQYEGFGRTRPVRENEKTIEEGQLNRRVEIRIVEK